MENKCPKCKKKLSIFYIKQNCPHCDCDLLNYDREASLQKDAEKAEAEFVWLENKLNKIKSITRIFKGKKSD